MVLLDDLVQMDVLDPLDKGDQEVKWDHQEKLVYLEIEDLVALEELQESVEHLEPQEKLAHLVNQALLEVQVLEGQVAKSDQEDPLEHWDLQALQAQQENVEKEDHLDH